MGLLSWIKNLIKPKATKPVCRTESDNASIDAYMEKTSYGYQIQNQKPTKTDDYDGMEP